MSELYDLYKKVGKDRFGAAVGEIAPYFSTINPQFLSLRPGHCKIAVGNDRSVHNHLGSIHAIAMCNGAELVAGLMTDVSIPDDRRWIPVGMTVRYLGLARNDIEIAATGSDIDWETLGEISVPCVVVCEDEEVMEADITMLISNKKS